ncbi:MAG: hypothetical protein KKI06_05760, partial [Euryarchaeota archaeon]|nr:hypothetical protein [Euryarchaeota archaeon]
HFTHLRLQQQFLSQILPFNLILASRRGLTDIVFDAPEFPESRIPGELRAHGALAGSNSVRCGGPRRSARD